MQKIFLASHTCVSIVVAIAYTLHSLKKQMHAWGMGYK